MAIEISFKSKNKKEKVIEEKKPINHRRVRAIETICEKTVYRRCFSEVRLLEEIGFELKENHSYHFITAGDIDSLSYLKLILLHQNLDYLLASTWCMSADDILQFDEWLRNGKIKKLDFYVGEIFPKTYKLEWQKLKEIFEYHKCGRIAVFKNHSKIYAGIGDKFAFGIETSANINTNPRTENGCITIKKELYEFYKEYFDGIKSFE